MLARNISTFASLAKFIGFSFGILASGLPILAQADVDAGENASFYVEPPGGLGQYYWISDSELLYFPVQEFGKSIKAWKRSLLTGKDIELIGLSRNLRETFADDHIFVSPNGQSVLWTSVGQIYTCPTMGDVRTEIALPGSLETNLLGWTRDGRNVVYYQGGGISDRDGITEFDYVHGREPGVSHVYSISEDSALRGTADPWRGSMYLPSLRLLAGDSVMLIPTGFSFFMLGDPVEIQTIKLSKNRKPMKTYQVKLPHAARPSDAIISADGTQLAWSLRFPLSKELWVSNVNGKNMRRLATLDTPGKNPNANEVTDFELQIKWLPSGTGISYRLKGTLCVVNLAESSRAEGK